MSRSVQIRVMGDPDEVDRAVAALCAALDVTSISRQYPRRRGTGVRVYLEARPRTGQGVDR